MAIAIARRLEKQCGGEALVITTSEARAEETGAALRCFAPDAEILVLPPWDCLPYDRASPSRECMGRRMAVLRRLQEPAEKVRVVIASVEAALQRLPPRETIAKTLLELESGATLDRAALEDFARRSGYQIDDRVDEPGEIAMLGAVVDIFPPDAADPVRLMLNGDRIEDIRSYDPLSQRTEEALPALRLGAASELVFEQIDEETPQREIGIEHRLPDFYPRLDTLFDLMPEAELLMNSHAAARAELVLEQIAEAYESKREFGGGTALEPAKLYLTSAEWEQACAGAKDFTRGLEARALPLFALERNRARAVADFVSAELSAGRRVIIAGAEDEVKGMIRPLIRHLKREPQALPSWSEIEKAKEGALLAAPFDLQSGFSDCGAGLTLIAAPDFFGSRIADSSQAGEADLLAGQELRVGDVVVHEDHGVGILRALERLKVEGGELDTIRLEYHGGASILVPIEEFGKLWRYGADAEAVVLDRLNTDGWQKRRAQVSAEVDEAAKGLVRLAKKRLKAKGEPIIPPAAAYQRLAARFPFPETPDQSAAIEAALEDLASGRPMNRLVCGDVGFGKTEIALRAAAAVALAGKQVALVAPTTVLVRQHLDSFEKRFAGSDVTVAQLSRLVPSAEAKKTKSGLADGSIRIVLGTQAVASTGVNFADLGLVIVDEEQRFGAKFKQQLAEMRRNVHFLTLSATPIPRTLQSVLAGLQDVSILATPPARRRPVRTFLAPFDRAAVRTALVREKLRGGQSFFVVPRIEDIEPMRCELENLVPDLKMLVAHGELPAQEVDESMVAFARGEADLLLATNIIESGLDVPRANTMLIWRADRFGLSQLHQLRGRVGRGRVQATAYLLTDPQEEIAEATRARLSTLEAYDRLGSGLEISMRDLDLRGGGDLLGEEQAGHTKLIGGGLYQQLMARAVRTAKGEAVDAGPEVHINLELRGFIPEDYVPEATIRINLYSRLQRIDQIEALDAFAEELEDRFGEPAEPVRVLIQLRRIVLVARPLGLARIDGGPLALALSLADAPSPAQLAAWTVIEGTAWKGERLVLSKATEADAGRLEAVETLLKDLGAKPQRQARARRSAASADGAPA